MISDADADDTWMTEDALTKRIPLGPEPDWNGTGETDPAGTRTGRWQFVDQHGQIWIYHYQRGNLDGPATAFDPSGKRRFIGFYSVGLPHGTFIFWTHEHGKDLELPVRHGVVHGYVRFFFPNGLLRCLLSYQSGRIDGEVFYWNEDGALQLEGIFQRGIRAGTVTIYDSDLASLERGEIRGEARQGDWALWHLDPTLPKTDA